MYQRTDKYRVFAVCICLNFGPNTEIYNVTVYRQLKQSHQSVT